MSWVSVIPNEGRARGAVPALLLVWHRLFRIFFLFFFLPIFLQRFISLTQATLFGCCPDGKTSAGGDGYVGCPGVLPHVPSTCADTTYGCCQDGLTEALGPNQYGCEGPIQVMNWKRFIEHFNSLHFMYILKEFSLKCYGANKFLFNIVFFFQVHHVYTK